MSHELVHDLVARLDAAPHGDKGRLVAEFARQVGVHPGTVRRWLRAEQIVPRRRQSQPRVPAETIAELAAIQRKCTDQGAKRRLPSDLVIAKAERQGMIQPGTISAGHFNRRLQEDGLRRRRPCVRFEARRSNELHHVDASGSEYFVVERHGDSLVVTISPPGSSRKNRPRSERELLWIYGVVDDHSRVMIGRYVAASGETAVDTIHTLAWAWSGEDPRLVMAGIPERVSADHGPFANSAIGQQFCASLGVELEPRQSGNPRAGGKVERPWRTCWSRFEISYLDDAGRTMSVEELNAEHVNYLAAEVRRRHPMLPAETRTQVYLRDRGEIRRVPENYLKAAWRPDPRKVGEDGTIRYDNALYRAPDDLVGERVQVYRCADGDLAASGPDGKVWRLEPFEALDAGEYRMRSAQPGDEVDKRAATLPPGPALYAEGHAGDEPATIAIPARGEPAHIDTPFDQAGKHPSIGAAMQRFGQRVGQPLAAIGEENLARIRKWIIEHELSVEYVDGLADELRDRLA